LSYDTETIAEKSKLQLLYENNNTNIKIGENNVLYQKCEGHIGVAPLITRIKGVWGRYYRKTHIGSSYNR
jgi:hypothetical protein